MKKEYPLSFESNLMMDVKLRENAILVIEHKEPVNPEALTFAVNEALKMHPVFQTKLEKRKKGYALVHNEKSPIIKEIPWDEAVNYGSSEYNDFPWVMNYTGNRTVFGIAHFLSDGMGVFNFIKTVLHYYFEKQGIVIASKECLVASENIEKTTEESIAANSKILKKKKVPTMEAFQTEMLPKDFLAKEINDNIVHHFVFPREIVSSIGQQTGGSSFSVLCALACKSVAEAAHLEKGNINANVAVDMRHLYDSITDLGFARTISLKYDIAKYKHIKDNPGYSDLRQQLTAHLNKDLMDHHIIRMNMLNGRLRGLFIMLGRKGFRETFETEKASIVYSHMTQLQLPIEIQSRLERVYITGTHVKSKLLLFHGVTFGDKIYMRVAEASNNGILLQKFEETLTTAGIPFEHRQTPGHGLMLYCPDVWEE